jgi:hypothetical protein
MMKTLTAKMAVLTDLDANCDLLQKNANKNFILNREWLLYETSALGKKIVYGSDF